MTKRKDGLWQEKIKLPDGSYQYYYGSTKSEVVRKIAEGKKKTEAKYRASSVADEWLEWVGDKVSPNTYPGYARDCKRFSSYFGDKPIDQIAPVDVEQYLEYQISEHDMARRTASNCLSVASRIFTYAVAHGYCSVNAARDIEVPRDLRKAKRHMPEDEQVKAILASRNICPPFGELAYWGLLTGLRKGELLGLTWEDIDLDARIIRVERTWYSKNNRPGVKSTKTEAGSRLVPIHDLLFDAIDEPGDGLVFPGLDGGLMTKTHYERGWARYQKAVGIESTMHELRHGFTTFLLESNVSPEMAASIIGHAQASTTTDIYNDIRSRRKAKEFQNIRSMSLDI